MLNAFFDLLLLSSICFIVRLMWTVGIKSERIFVYGQKRMAKGDVKKHCKPIIDDMSIKLLL